MAEKDRPIAVIGAMTSETDYIIGRMETKSTRCIGGWIFISGLLGGKSVVVVRCFIGMANAAAATALLIENYNPCCVIIQGTSGGHNPLLHKGDIVIGERPISNISDFSPLKKKLQRIGSWAVRQASKTDIPDAPSGFRAFSREAALRLNVVNDYTYTLETIVQAGREKIPIVSVPISTNPAVRPSRLAKTMLGYVRTSMLTILRAYLVYKPLKAFLFLSLFPAIPGIIIWIRFLYFFVTLGGAGHIQSLILACTLIIIGFVCVMIGILGDTIGANRKILQDIQYHSRKQYYDGVKIAEPVKREKCRIYYR